MYNTEDKNLLQLTKKIRENPQSFVFVLGAGMSIPAGMPSWKELADGMIDYYEQLFQNAEDYDEKRIANLRAMDRLWDVFSELKRALPSNEYNRYIKEQLSVGQHPIPQNYKLIWQLDVCGVITFNIDKLILNAYTNLYHTMVDFATRKEFFKYDYFPVSNEKFVFFPHGEISDPSSWVFTDEERKAAYKDRNFTNILASLLNGKNLVVVGFNPREESFLTLLNDIAIGEAISGYDNYYIGENIQAADIRKLGEYGIRCISYSPEDEKHSDIEKMLKGIYAYAPKDIEYPAVYQGKGYSPQDIPPHQKCLDMGLDKLRDILNGNIAEILPANEVPTNEQIKQLQEFYKKYSAQLHIAWYIDPASETGRNLYGYTLERAVGRGAFGNVFEAYDDKGSKYAVKILLPEVKDKARYLSCFRRGIRSMKMLKDHNIEGMVKIHSSYEVPACIIMDFVEGLTLREAVDNRLLCSFHMKLEVLKMIAEIIHKSHNLSECILHRDLKPENIMLENYYYEDETELPKVVILDFDLSWHKGATELTVALGAMSQGFMAPEQAEEKGNYTRNTAVDVYSIGMISYYVLTEKNPAPYQHRFSHFQEELLKDIRDKYKTEWICAAQFMAETIVKSTFQEAKDRISLEAYLANIKVVLDMILSNEISNVHPLLLRELASQIDNSNGFEVSDFGRKVLIRTPELGKTICLELKQHSRDVLVQVEIKKLRKGDENRNKTAKYLENAKNRALADVKQDLFFQKAGDVGLSEVTIILKAKLPGTVTHSRLVQMAQNIQEVRSRLELQ